MVFFYCVKEETQPHCLLSISITVPETYRVNNFVRLLLLQLCWVRINGSLYYGNADSDGEEDYFRLVLKALDQIQPRYGHICLRWPRSWPEISSESALPAMAVHL